MSKIYSIIAVWTNAEGNAQATRVADGEAGKLAVDLSLCPQGTHRLAVMERKKWDELLKIQEASASAPQTSDESP